MMNSRERQALDRHITGNYGEDQFQGERKRRKYTRPYVGVKHDGTREVFRLAFRPTEDLWAGTYRLVIGPFKTTRGAQFMAEHGDDHTHSIRDAERIAAQANEGLSGGDGI